MKSLLSMGMAFCLSLTMLASCQRSKGVHAGNDAVDYQPRSGMDTGIDVTKERSSALYPEIKGDLLRVDVANHALLMRVENGMDQTIKWNNATRLYGVPDLGTVKASKSKQDFMSDGKFKTLAAVPGSALAVEWVDDNGEKVATVINVTDLSPVRKNLGRKARR